jgi:hypothetical protein
MKGFSLILCLYTISLHCKSMNLPVSRATGTSELKIVLELRTFLMHSTRPSGLPDMALIQFKDPHLNSQHIMRPPFDTRSWSANFLVR